MMTDDWQAGVDDLKVGRVGRELEAEWGHFTRPLLQVYFPQSAAGCMWVVGRV